MTLVDLDRRKRALTDLGTTLLVEAAAGTGKTSLMAGRVAMLLASGQHPKRVAAITFTEPAAAEEPKAEKPQREQSPPKRSAPRLLADQAAPPAPEPLLAKPKRQRERHKPLAEKIAPKKRTASEREAIALARSAQKPQGPSLWRKRDLPKGRGRFSQVNTTKAALDELLKPAAKGELQALIEQTGNRVALKRRLEATRPIGVSRLA